MFFLIAGWREISDSNKVNRQKSHTKKTWQNPKPPTKIVVNYLCLSFFFFGGLPFFEVPPWKSPAEVLGITQDQDHRIAAQEHLANEAVLFQTASKGPTQNVS